MTGAAAPDVQTPGTYTSAKSCVDIVQDVAMNYVAQAHFVGLVAGLTGTAHEQQRARDTAKKAIEDLAEDANSFFKAAKNAAGAEVAIPIATFGARFGQMLARITGDDQAADSVDRTVPQAQRQQIFLRAQYQKYFGQIWKTFVDECRTMFNKIVESFRNGNWKVVLCQLGVELAFQAVQKALVALLAASGIGSAAAAGLLVIRTIARRAGGKVYSSAVSIARRDRPDIDIKYGEIRSGDITHPELKKGLGEENQGRTAGSPTDDKGPAETKGDKSKLSNGAIGSAAEAQAKKDLAAKGFTDQRTITNPQGNGVDIIARNPQTGEVVFGEVKANSARMSADQADRGGPDYVQDRLTRVNNKLGEWSGATPQQVADARSALKWLDNGPAFKEIKYDVDPTTGAATNYRERSWDYPPGQRPKPLPWRDAQGAEVSGKGKPKANRARGPP